MSKIMYKIRKKVYILQLHIEIYNKTINSFGQLYIYIYTIIYSLQLSRHNNPYAEWAVQRPDY